MNKRVDELNSEEAKALLGDTEISEEKLKTVLERIKAFCKVAYELYVQSTTANDVNNPEKKLDIEPPEKFTNAA